MSNRNSQANKQAARERLRVEREQQHKRERTRRKLLVGGSVVAVLAVAGGIGIAVANSGGGGDDGAEVWAKAADTKLVKPANTTGENGTVITIGKQDAKNTLEFFEDPRCPGCATFEQNVGPTIQKDIEDGKYKATFHMGTFLDRNLQGTGSKNSLSALGAALNVSPDAFLKYKEALFSKKYHPDETGADKFADNSYLIKVADTVAELKDNKSFQSDVKKGTFNKWALETSDAFNKIKDVKSTPTVKVNGKIVATPSGGAPTTAETFNEMVGKELKS